MMGNSFININGLAINSDSGDIAWDQSATISTLAISSEQEQIVESMAQEEKDVIKCQFRISSEDEIYGAYPFSILIPLFQTFTIIQRKY